MKMLFKNAYVYRRGSFSRYDISVCRGRIGQLADCISPVGQDVVFDFSNCYISPGFADVHVHLREPGFSYKETILNGTMAAARGGFTDVCAMPNLNPVPDCLENIAEEQKIIDRDAVIRVHPYASITLGRSGGGKIVDMASLKNACCGFSDDGCGIQDDAVMKTAMKKAVECKTIIAAHCEDESMLCGGYIHKGSYAISHGHKGISSESEYSQIARDIAIAEKTGCRYHVCHISAAESVQLIRDAKKRGVDITCETAPHYLALCEDDLKEDGRYKMNPPLRTKKDRDELLAGIADGTIDMIATDHAPHSNEEKAAGLKNSAFGISGLECAFSVCYEVLVKSGIITLERLIELMSVNPRKRFGLPDNSISPGGIADFTVLDVSHPYTINSADFLSCGKSTPFDGYTASARPIMTICDGRTVWKNK